MISIIVAFDDKGGIGLGKGLPWPHLAVDMGRFRALTINNTVVMGRKTFETIGRVLPKRRNIVITRDEGWSYPGIEVCHDLKSCLKDKGYQNVFVIGGKQIYDLALPYAYKLYTTHVQGTHDADTFWTVDTKWWSLDNEELIMEEGEPICTFRDYSRIIPERLL